jgi:hypothetical protein
MDVFDIYQCSDVKEVMHIAHSPGPEFLPVETVARLAGLKKRQVQNCARTGEIPGVLRAANGYHLAYPDTPELRLWCKQKRRIARERAQGRPTPVRWYSPRRDVDLQLPQKLAVAFHEWNSWMRENQPLHGWEEQKLRALKTELEVFHTVYEAVAKHVKYHEGRFLERARDGMPCVVRHPKGQRPELIRLDALSD